MGDYSSKQAGAYPETERTVRRCLAEIRRSFLPEGEAATVGALTAPELLTAARQLAFLYLLEAGRSSAPAKGALARELADHSAAVPDRFYAEVVCPRCAELLAEARPVAPTVPDAQIWAWLELFAGWKWSLVEGVGQNRVTPELLGALCEGALDQKAQGVFFTSPDVTTYICANVLLPALLPAASSASSPPRAEEWLPGWERPGCVDRYLHPLRREAALLPLEAEYERTARLAQVERCRNAWSAGEIRTPDDWITWNLDLARLLTDWIAATTDEPALKRFMARLGGIRVLDPTCGSGAFLIGALETLLPVHYACWERGAGPGHFPERGGSPDLAAEIVARMVGRNLYGIDQAEEAVETCRMRLLLRVAAEAGRDAASPTRICFQVRLGDVLLDEVFPEVTRASSGFDAVVGNPPYVAYASGGRYANAGYRTEGSENLYALVTERAVQWLRPDGRLGVILPVSSTSLVSFRPLAELLQQGNAWVSSYSNRPAKLFPGVEQRLSIWITGPSSSPVTYASAYQHWYAEERPQLFSRLTYARAASWEVTGFPIKSGSEVPEAIFAKLMAHAGRLGAYECPEDHREGGGETVWLHDGPTYWVRALAFDPGCGAEPRIGHYHRIRVAGEREALVLAAILSSTTYYFFFKMVSNCRDLGRKEWISFPIDPLSPSRETELEALGRCLQERLRETARTRLRRYPRSRVEYREYYPARAKSTLDAIDAVLAAHYGLSAAESDYLLNYDRKYRMGQNDAG